MSGAAVELPYRLEVDHGEPPNPAAPHGWRMIVQDHSVLYLRGLATGWTASLSPRSAVRLVRAKDGKVVETWPASDSPQIGAVAGWPTADQCIRAAKAALRQVRAQGTTPEEIRKAATALAALGGDDGR